MPRLRLAAISSIVVAIGLLSLAVEGDSRAAPPVAPAGSGEAQATALQGDPAQPAQVSPGTTGGGDSPRGASTSNQQGCLPASELPPALTSLASAPDCATAAVVLDSGDALAGTVEGNVVVARASGTDKYPSNGTGPVTAMVAVELWAPPDFTASVGHLVTYAVEEGIGVFDPRSGSNVTFGGSPLRDKGYRPVDPARYFARGQFILMDPVQGRPRLNSLGQYALTKPDGQDEALILSLGGGSACARYIPSPGAVPQQRWCTEVSGAGPKPPPVTPPPVVPQTCAGSSGAHADPPQTISVTVGRSGITPTAISLRSGERYVVILKSTDHGVLHYLRFVDSSARMIRDANGAIVLCLPIPPLAGEVVSADFVAPDLAGAAYLECPLHSNERVTVTFEPPVAATAAAGSDVTSLTPVTSPSPTPTFIMAVPADVATPTPAPTSPATAGPPLP